MHTADHETRILAIQAITRLPLDAAKVIYQDFVVAASAGSKGLKLSFDEAVDEGWQVYRRALVEKGDASQAQAHVERWLSIRATWP